MSSTTVVKKTTRRVVTSDGKENVSESVSTERHSASSSNNNYQVYRGMSPTTQSRIENRVKELEGALEQERAAHDRTHTEATTLHLEVENTRNLLEAAEKEIASQIDIVRRREQELLKAKKDLELLTVQHEASEASLKKRFTDQINQLNEQLDRANKAKSKIEKDKQQLVVEIDGITIQIHEANKAKSYAEAKVEDLEDELKRHRFQLEEFSRSNYELKTINTRLTQENAELLHQLQDIEAKHSSSVQFNTNIQQKLDITMAKLEEEKKNCSQLGTHVSSVTADFDRVRFAFDEQSKDILKLQSQLQTTQTENQIIKARYDKDITTKIEEFEELKRKLSTRVTELEGQLEQFRTKAARLEKEKSKLIIQMEDITVHLETIKVSLNEHTKLLKQAETNCTILQKRNDELNLEKHGSSSEIKRLQTELIQAKQTVADQQEKIDSVAKENYKLNETIHELQITIKEFSQQQQDWFSARIQLKSDHNLLQSKLSDANDTIHELQLKLETSNSVINQLTIDYENGARGKNDEIESMRKSSQRTIEELHLQITELESKSKAENSRWKNKIETACSDFEQQIDSLSKSNTELLKVNKSLSIRLKEIETLLEVERQTVEKITESRNVVEYKLLSLQKELEDIHTQLTSVEKARKNAESEKAESKLYITEMNVVIQTLTVEKRRLESDLAASQREFTDSVSALKAAEEKAEKLASDIVRLTDQLRLNQNNLVNTESKNKQLEIKIRELVQHIEQLETAKDSKKSLIKLQSQIAELEKELDSEQRNGRDLTGETKKLQRLLSEMKLSSETERLRSIEYSNTINTLESRITTLKRQLQDSGEMLSITLAKYRKTQQLLEDAERRADESVSVIHHKTIIAGASGSTSSVRRRSYSVTRESNSHTSRLANY
jgi:chromosome segregation ATPase